MDRRQFSTSELLVLEGIGWRFVPTAPEEWEWVLFNNMGQAIERGGSKRWREDVERAERVALDHRPVMRERPEWYPSRDKVERAALYAVDVLEELEAAGIANPSIELFRDGSGRLRLNQTGTDRQLARAYELLGSTRLCSEGNGYPIIAFSHGLIVKADEKCSSDTE